MVKKIFHISDIHIPNSEENRPYSKMIDGFLSDLVKQVATCGCKQDEVRIVLVGDIFQQKIKASNEAKQTFHKMLNVLNALAKTIIVAGNHDMLENNTDRMDSITPTFEITGAYPNVTYIDKVLNYQSGCLIDDNITWVLFSMFDKFKKPVIPEKTDSDSRVIGLYHGDVAGAVTDMGRMSEGGINTDEFKECDCVMAGHIHKYQVIKKNGVPIVYPSSLLQQNAGENVTMHGYVIWDIVNMTHIFHEVPNDYRIYKFELMSYDDIKEDIERLVNL